MTRNFIPGIDDDYKFTRSEYAQFLGISPNALRMKMRRGTHSFDYVIKDGKYLFKRPRENQGVRPPLDHVQKPYNPSRTSTKKTYNRGAHKEGKANYTNTAFEMHNEMKILNSINKKFKSDEKVQIKVTRETAYGPRYKMFEISKNSYNQNFSIEEYGLNLISKNNKVIVDTLKWNGLAKKSGFETDDILTEIKIENKDRPSKNIIYPFALVFLLIFGYLNYRKKSFR